MADEVNQESDEQQFNIEGIEGASSDESQTDENEHQDPDSEEEDIISLEGDPSPPEEEEQQESAPEWVKTFEA